jgi:hypothetical protein
MLATVRPALRLSIKRDRQRCQNPVQIPHNLFIRESNDAKAELPQHASVAGQIDLSLMRIAVQFNREPLHRAEEIDDAKSDHFLPAEFVSAELLTTESRPEPALRFGWIVAHLAGALEEEVARDAITPNPLF